MLDPEKGPALIIDNTPIWQKANAEKLPGSSPHETLYIIWKYKPGEEGVNEYPPYGQYDPAPRHYYRSRQEYEEAKHVFSIGGYPEQRINISSFKISRREELPIASVPQLTVFESPIRKEAVEPEKAAA